MNILLINAYSYKNLGDSGIVVAMIEFLRDTYEDPDISVMSSDYEGNAAFYGGLGVNSVSPPWDISYKIRPARKIISGVYSLLLSIFKSNSRPFSAYRDADLILSVGGGYLYSSVKGPLGIGFLNVLFNLWLAKRFSKKIICFPQSIGPFSNALDEILAKFILKKMDRIYVREHRSNKSILKFDNVKIFPDFALTLKKQRAEVSNTVGVTVLDWQFAQQGATESVIDDYILKVAKAISAFESGRGWGVKVYPQVDVSDGDSDVGVSNALVDALHSLDVKASLCSVKGLTHENIILEYSSNSIFIASRMHSAIFAIDGEVPVIGLAYQPKMTGTMELLGMGGRCLDIAKFDIGELTACLEGIQGESVEYCYPLAEFKGDFSKFI